MNPYFCGLRPLVALCSLFASLSVWAAEDNAALLRQGEYVARAADCAACHRTVEKGGPALAGGYAIDSPMGKIIASNITPSKTHGIGDYAEHRDEREHAHEGGAAHHREACEAGEIAHLEIFHHALLRERRRVKYHAARLKAKVIRKRSRPAA